MNKLLLNLVLNCFVLNISAQNIGLGTNTPHHSAAFEIKSNNKGLLIPRMSNFQRLGISSPANGLLVYDTVYNEFYHYEGSKWVPILNSNYWIRPAASRDRIGNTSDSVGIGTASPTHRLDVNGNIRSRDDILADGKIVAQSSISGGSLNTSGGLVVAGIGYIVGDFTTNGTININNTAGTLNFKASGNDKAFVQLSGDNLRIGTYSGNDGGRIILRSGGTDRMTVFENGNVNIGSSAANAARLRVAGDLSVQDNIEVQDNIDLAGKLTRNNITGSSNMLPLCYGTVRNGVLVRSTSNVSVSWVAYNEFSGYYRIQCNGINSSSVLLATPLYSMSFNSSGTSNWLFSVVADYVSSGVASVHILWLPVANGNVYSEKDDFSFIIY